MALTISDWGRHYALKVGLRRHNVINISEKITSHFAQIPGMELTRQEMSRK